MYTGAVLPGPGVAGAGGRHLLPAAPAGRGPLPLHRGGPQPDLLHSLLSHSDGLQFLILSLFQFFLMELMAKTCFKIIGL